MLALSKADNGVVLTLKIFCKPSSKYCCPGAEKNDRCPCNFLMNCISSFTALGAIQFAYYSLPTWVSPRLK